MKVKSENYGVKILIVLTLIVSTLNAQKTDAKSAELLDLIVEVNGGYANLASKKDVEATYEYHVLDKGKDFSLERYIFNGEHSWGKYTQHEVPNYTQRLIYGMLGRKQAITFGLATSQIFCILF